MTWTVEVWADIVCPWCYIGKKRLADASDATGIDIAVVHRAFQLDPNAKTTGERALDMLVRKYAVAPDQARAMQDNVTEVARSVGLDYHLDRTLVGNTLTAHRLVLWAQEQGRGQALLECLYRAYFTDGLPVFAVDDLLPFVEVVGLDPEAAVAMLMSGDYAGQVLDEQALAGEYGANGVPFFVLDGRLGVPGAQPQEVFEAALRQMAGSS